MKFFGNYEFRAFSRVNGKDGIVYNFVNLEDDTGENCRFFASKVCNPSSYENLKKGCKVKCEFNYSTKYGSICLTDIMEVK